MTRKSVFTVFIILSVGVSYSQTDSVKYTRDFVFKEGIYLTIDDFKNNRPNLTPENFKQYNSEVGYLDEKFFEDKGFLKSKRKIFYPDSLGNIKERRIDSLFCYVEKNHVFLIWPTDMGFAVLRIFKLGPISHCIQISKRSTSYTVPYVGADGYTYGYGISTKSPSGKEKQYLVNFTKQKLYDYTRENFERQLKKIDDTLYQEFSQLSNSKKKKMMFVYLNKVNEKYPIYFKN